MCGFLRCEEKTEYEEVVCVCVCVSVVVVVEKRKKKVKLSPSIKTVN